MSLTRRHFLQGVGGAVLGLPALESLGGKSAFAQNETVPPFVIFFRQANGVAQAQQNNEIGDEPERFFPRTLGELTTTSMAGRAVGELSDYRSRLLVLRNVNMDFYDYGDGHANGAMQGLTARGPEAPGLGGSSEAGGESLDFRIGRELNPDGRDSLYLFTGQNGGWLNGACISHRGAGQRHFAQDNPWNAYQAFVSGDSTLPPDVQERLRTRQQSVNDLVRTQMQRLLNGPQLSGEDRQRLQLHFDSVRELELSLTCRLEEEDERALENLAPLSNSSDGDEVLETARLHMDVAALAVACGHTRSVAIQVGNGNDGDTRYRNLDSGQPMERYHYLSHRRQSHGADGAIIANSDLLHHYVDVQFARTFRHLVQRLDAYQMPTGRTLLEHGVAIWYNDNSNGPPHGSRNIPWILAGSCDGYFKQGEMVELNDGGVNHNRLLNTIGTAVGVRKANGDPLDDFGEPGTQGGLLSEVQA